MQNIRQNLTDKFQKLYNENLERLHSIQGKIEELRKDERRINHEVEKYNNLCNKLNSGEYNDLISILETLLPNDKFNLTLEQVDNLLTHLHPVRK